MIEHRAFLPNILYFGLETIETIDEILKQMRLI